jgi:hypothetical protein
MSAGRQRVGLTCLVGIGLWTAQACAGDLSALPEFNRLDIGAAISGDTSGSFNKAGALQLGRNNVGDINQTGGLGNNAQLWQQGSDLRADISQIGAGNLIRLNQEGSLSQATLVQNGMDNLMLISQVGVGASVNGLQVGDGNSVLLLQRNDTSFGFSQIGNQNQISVELPNGMGLHVDQIGNNLSYKVSPN